LDDVHEDVGKTAYWNGAVLTGAAGARVAVLLQRSGTIVARRQGITTVSVSRHTDPNCPWSEDGKFLDLADNTWTFAP
jgi:hypothetical protein